MNIPTKAECLAMLRSNNTPSNVIEHSIAVCKVAEAIVDHLIAKGIPINKELVCAGAMLHDIEKTKKNHVQTGAELVEKLGFPEVSKIIARHSLYNFQNEEVQPHSFEEKIVFYADKRLIGSNVVQVEERFADLKKRYDLPHLDKEFEFTLKIERELDAKNLGY